MVKLGPGPALSGFLRRVDQNAEALNVPDVPSLEATVKVLAA